MGFALDSATIFRRGRTHAEKCPRLCLYISLWPMEAGGDERRNLVWVLECQESWLVI